MGAMPPRPLIPRRAAAPPAAVVPACLLRACRMLACLMLACLLPAAAGCVPPAKPPRLVAPATRIRVATASDLRPCLDALADAFQQDFPNVDLLPTFGASGTLVEQLRSGLEADLFLSADVDLAHDLAAAGLAAAEDVFETGQGRVVVWVRNESPLDVAGKGAGVLRDGGVRRVAIAHPRHAPYGRAGRAALESLGLLAELEPKLAVGSSAAQAAQYVESGAAEAGILPLALARGRKLSETGRHWTFPADAHPPIRHGGVILARAIDREATVAFRDFLLSPRGRAVLERHGFEFPTAAAP